MVTSGILGRGGVPLTGDTSIFVIWIVYREPAATVRLPREGRRRFEGTTDVRTFPASRRVAHRGAALGRTVAGCGVGSIINGPRVRSA